MTRCTSTPPLVGCYSIAGFPFSIKFVGTHLCTCIVPGQGLNSKHSLQSIRPLHLHNCNTLKKCELAEVCMNHYRLAVCFFFFSQCPCNWPEPSHQRVQSSSQMTIAHAIQLTFLNVEYNIHQYNYLLFYKELFTFSCTIPYSNRNRSQNE